MKSNSLEMHALVVAREGAALTPPITLTLTSGEMLVVHGKNGSGKSTLLKTIAGLISPEAGKFTYAHPGNDTILYMGHKLGLSKEMSVYDNVALWAKLHYTPELTAAAMHYFDLGDVADVAVGTLSAGWQQRVALTRLITIPSHLWVLDEPTANLDAEGVAHLRTLMESRLEQGGMIVVATHAPLEGKMIKTIDINGIN